MSGGSYDYAYRRLDDFASELREKGSCSAASPILRRAFADHCRKVAKAMKACEWNDSCDGNDSEAELILAVINPSDALSSATDTLKTTISEANVLLEMLVAEEKE